MVLKFITKLILLSTLIFSFSSCAHTSKTDNLAALKAGSMAAVISGCAYDYKAKFLFTTDAKQQCIATWENASGEQFTVNNYLELEFVKPGTYEFVGYQSRVTNRSSYKKFPKAISIFNKIELKGGDVFYLGTLSVDSRKTKQVLGSMQFIQDFSAAKTYVQNNYPVLLGKLQLAPVTYSDDAVKVRELMSSFKK